MTVVIYEDWVARGWKSIADRLDCSVSFARKLFTKEGLPLVNEGGTWTLTAQDFKAWREKRRAIPVKSSYRLGKMKDMKFITD